jgi:hypothetical protein
MGHGEGRVREGLDQRSELLQMLRRLQDPALARPVPLEDLEDRLQVLVVGPLVVREVVVAPMRAPRDPFLIVAREVRQLQLELLVDVVGTHRMHRRRQGGDRLHRVPGVGASDVAGVLCDVVRDWRGRHGLLPLPQRHRAKSTVGGDQIDEVGRAGAWETHDDDRLPDLDLVDLRVLVQELVDPKPVRRVANAIVEVVQAAQGGALGVGVHLGEPDGQAFFEVVGAEVG